MPLRLTVLAALLIGCNTESSDPDTTATDPGPELDLPTVILDPQTGDPGLQSVDHLAFGPAGHLFVGDGYNDRLVIIATTDVLADESADDWERIGNLYKTIGDALGVDEDDVEISDVTVNPRSGRTYVAGALQDGSFAGIFTVTADGDAEVLALDTLDWVAVDYPEVQGSGSVVTEIEVTSEWAVASVTEQAWTSSLLITLPLPIAHGDDVQVTTTQTFHRSHGQWETFAPITTMFSYEDEDGAWIGASYQCAPVVRFDIAELAEGKDETVGITPFDYGPGRQVRDFAVQGSGDDARVFASVSGLGGTSVKPSLFLSKNNVDEQSPIVFDGSAQADNNKVDKVPKLDDMLDLAVQDDTRLVRLDTRGELQIVETPSR